MLIHIVTLIIVEIREEDWAPPPASLPIRPPERTRPRAAF